jgi:Family of unknown function (DUF5360)
MNKLPAGLRPLFWITDIGFILYWLITLAQIIPKAYLFKDYDNPILQAWNWSFLPLDLAISATGLATLSLLRRQRSEWKSLAIVSLTLTFCSGLQAIAFWVLRDDFDWQWWLPNSFLLLYPLWFLPKLIFNDND